MKSFIRILAFIAIWPSLIVYGEAQKKPLTIDLVTREGAIVARGISNLEWRPGRLDDTPVPQYPLTEYLSTHAALSFERFPQPGDANPIPSFHVVTVDQKEIKSWSPPEKSSIEYFGPSFSWTPDSKAISFLTLNRAQNELTVRLWAPFSGTGRDLLVERDPYWINSLDPPHFLADGRFLWLSERDGWLHLYLYDRDGNLLKQLTKGDWLIEHPLFSDVPMVQVDEKSGWVYFTSTNPDPRERQVYRVGINGGEIQRLTRDPGNHSLNLSPSGQFFIDAYSNVNNPPQIRLLKSDGSFIATLDKPENHLSDYALSRTEFVEVKADDGATLYVRLVKPADFDPTQKYPAIVYVYGGPHVQLIQNRWGETPLLDHLFAQHGFLIWSLDNRGSWGRGHAWESAIFKDMGRHELADQLAGVSYLKSLPYVDGNRLGIWGWSYGGHDTVYFDARARCF